jgi:hypothetical protein
MDIFLIDVVVSYLSAFLMSRTQGTLAIDQEIVLHKIVPL